VSNEKDLQLLISVFGVHKGSKIEGRTRIQKEICLLKYQSREPFTFDYKSYYYGPYSEDLAETIERLVTLRFLEEKITSVGIDSLRYDYILTEAGKESFRKIRQNLSDSVTRISREVRELDDLPTPSLVSLAKRISGIESLRETEPE
jgi:uncharacterized protein YwgA